MRLPRAAPCGKGVTSAGILAFLDDAANAGLELHCLVLFRRGAVVAEGFWHPYGPSRRQAQPRSLPRGRRLHHVLR